MDSTWAGMSKTQAPTAHPAVLARLVLFCPDTELHFALMLGALEMLGNDWYWDGAASDIEQTVQEYREAITRTAEKRVSMYVGEIFYAAGEITSQDCIKADGRELPKADYTELYAIIGDVWGAATSGFFRVPNIGARTIVASGTDTGLTNRTLADKGGNERVTLDSGEIPYHSHSIHSHLEALAVAPGELPVTVPNVLPDSTGGTGGGASHQNMQPYIVLNAYIVVR